MVRKANPRRKVCIKAARWLVVLEIEDVPDPDCCRGVWRWRMSRGLDYQYVEDLRHDSDRDAEHHRGAGW